MLPHDGGDDVALLLKLRFPNWRCAHGWVAALPAPAAPVETRLHMFRHSRLSPGSAAAQCQHHASPSLIPTDDWHQPSDGEDVPRPPGEGGDGGGAAPRLGPLLQIRSSSNSLRVLWTRQGNWGKFPPTKRRKLTQWRMVSNEMFCELTIKASDPSYCLAGWEDMIYCYHHQIVGLMKFNVSSHYEIFIHSCDVKDTGWWRGTTRISPTKWLSTITAAAETTSPSSSPGRHSSPPPSSRGSSCRWSLCLLTL